jgi:hypothetical protein
MALQGEAIKAEGVVWLRGVATLFSRLRHGAVWSVLAQSGAAWLSRHCMQGGRQGSVVCNMTQCGVAKYTGCSMA